MNWQVFINTLRFKAEQRRAVLSDDTTANTLEAVADSVEFALRDSLDLPRPGGCGLMHLAQEIIGQ